jgi:putative solute:sodium symporter small subunit
MSDPISTADPGDFDSGAGGAVPGSSASSAAHAETEETTEAEGAYWRENIRLLVGLMAIWFTVSFGCGILFRGFLDQFSLGGYPLGFWFAQQGSIYVFIALIVFYVVRMKQIERKYDLDD